MPALIPAYIQWVTSDNPLLQTNSHAAVTDLASSLLQHLISASLQSLYSPPSPVPAQYSHWSRAMAHTPPCSYTPSLPAALRTHAATQVRWLIARRAQAGWLPCSDLSHFTLSVWSTFFVHGTHTAACLSMCFVHPHNSVCMILLHPVTLRPPRVASASLPERPSNPIRGPISVVANDRVMTALWPPFDPGICFEILTLKLTPAGAKERSCYWTEKAATTSSSPRLLSFICRLPSCASVLILE